ncbi:hypothetical protein HPP92_007364 [Vanilla planifolia]|uniref:Uncharacterized protein n=1 Tax=Vanilla planifolia TaxID=51239 RepID=A0A835RLT0_VANPL|nr:hypothetical protein HPP92_007364 [Vanilla planifolia]
METFLGLKSPFLFPSCVLDGINPATQSCDGILIPSVECLKLSMDRGEERASVFFFPEGTQKGAFSVAAKTEAPVVLITILGTGQLMPAGMEGILRSGSVKVVIQNL